MYLMQLWSKIPIELMVICSPSMDCLECKVPWTEEIRSLHLTVV